MGSIPPKQHQKINELKTEVEELQNPTDRPPAGTPREGVQIIDRQRLMAAWESNVKTLRGVLDQMAIAQQTNMLTRWITIATLICNLAILAYMTVQIGKITSMVHRIELNHDRQKAEHSEGQ